MRIATITARTMEIVRTTVTRALISCVKPTRIIAQRRIGKVESVPVINRVMSVSSKDSAKARIAAEPMAGIRPGSST